MPRLEFLSEEAAGTRSSARAQHGCSKPQTLTSGLTFASLLSGEGDDSFVIPGQFCVRKIKRTIYIVHGAAITLPFIPSLADDHPGANDSAPPPRHSGGRLTPVMSA